MASVRCSFVTGSLGLAKICPKVWKGFWATLTFWLFKILLVYMVYIYIYKQKEKNERYIHTNKQQSCSPLYCFQLKKGLSSPNSFGRSFQSFAVGNRKWQTKHAISCGWQRSIWKRLNANRPKLLRMPFVQDLRWADKILRIAWFWRLSKRWELSAYYNLPTLYTYGKK